MKNNEVRVRFAPSPSGRLHIGNLRTALINWLFAKSANGTFILRIENTDSENTSDEMVSAIMDDLLWVGLDWDEGYGKGGEFEPYIQSLRKDIYKNRLKELHDRGVVYPCFCSKERLDELRIVQRARGEMPHYDNLCRNIPKDEAMGRIADGESHTWRFKLPDLEFIEFDDLIYGKKRFPVDSLGGDPVIVRSNGDFLFIFAGAVDDVLMNITHVVRGEDHLSNTARQVEIIKALGGKIPKFVHMPLILGTDGKPLSKRVSSTSIKELREIGIVSDALINYISTLGFSPPSDLGEIFTLNNLVSSFDESRLSRSPSIYDFSRLKQINSKHISLMDAELLLEFSKAFFDKSDVVDGFSNKEMLLKAIDSIKDEARFLSDIPKLIKPFESGFRLDYASSIDFIKSIEDAILVANTVKNICLSKNLSPDEFIAELKQQTKLKGAKLFKPLRIILTASPSGAPLKELLEILSNDEISRRADEFLSFIKDYI